MELSKWSKKIEECNWTPDSQESTISAPGFITLIGTLRIDIKVYEFGFLLIKYLMTELNEYYLYINLVHTK